MKWEGTPLPLKGTRSKRTDQTTRMSTGERFRATCRWAPPRFQVLSDPRQRAEYDAELRSTGEPGRCTRLGLRGKSWGLNIGFGPPLPNNTRKKTNKPRVPQKERLISQHLKNDSKKVSTNLVQPLKIGFGPPKWGFPRVPQKRKPRVPQKERFANGD